jgi:Arc/MetJ-type ribon-helix-helix transcriptional regulator
MARLRNTAKVAISLDSELLARVDRLVRSHVFPSRSRAVQMALRDKLERIDRSRLGRECAKLDPEYEKSIAEEDLPDLGEWPEY